MLGLVNLSIPQNQRFSKICWNFDVKIAPKFWNWLIEKALINENW